MAMTEQTKSEKKYDIEQSINVARLTLGEAKFILGKDDLDQVEFLVERTIKELQDIKTKLLHL